MRINVDPLKCGVRVADGESIEWFVRLADGCGDTQGCPTFVKCTRTSTSNATKHLSAKHQTISPKAAPHVRIVSKLAKQSDMSNASFAEDSLRWFQARLVAWSAGASLACRVFEIPRWRLIAAQLPVGDKSMQLFNCRKVQIELCIPVRNLITARVAAVRREHSTPFISLNLDLIKNPNNNKKFLAARISYNARQESDASFNLAIRRYSPPVAECNSAQTSDLTVQWTRGILLEFGISLYKDVLTRTPP
ncbi:hypothetical protein FI667_g15189, partial [Globisporangium splendens]